MGEDRSNVVSGSNFAAVLGCVALGLYVLLPSDREMTERLSEDGNYGRALEVLESMPASEKAKNKEFYQTTRVRLQRMLAQTAEQSIVQDILKEAVDAYRELGQKAEELFVELIKVLQMLTDPLGAVAIIEPALDDLPVDSRTELYRTLSELALSREEPELAAEIFSKYLLDNLDDSNAVWESARLWRMAAKPDKALEAIDTYSIANVTNLFAQEQKLFTLKMHLLREVTRAADAHESLHNVLDGELAFPVEDEADLRELSELYVQTGVETEKGEELVPFITHFLDRYPMDWPFWEQLAIIYTQVTRFNEAIAIYEKLIEAEPEVFRYQEAIAQIYEWNNQRDLAYEWYLKAASPERQRPLDRLVALHPVLYRTSEFEPLLAGMLPIEGRPDLLLEHARILTRLGRYEKSIDRYRDYLKESPEDQYAVVEVADVCFEYFLFDDAEKFYRRAVELRPGDLRVRKRVGESLYLDSRYDESFEYFKEYLESGEQFDIQAVETFGRLARALGYYDDLSTGLEQILAMKGQPSSDDFLALAQNYYYRKEYEDQSAILEKGLERHPDDTSLIYFLGLSYSAQREYLKVAEIIEKSTASLEDPKIFELYMEVLIANHDWEKALEMARPGIAEGAFESTGMKRRLAVIYEGNQLYGEASELLKELTEEDPTDQASALAYSNVLNILGKRSEARAVLEPFMAEPTPDILKAAAAIAAASGEFKVAEEYQMAYLDAAEDPTFYEMGFLGDIRLELGMPDQSKIDYEAALLKMLNVVIEPEQVASK